MKEINPIDYGKRVRERRIALGLSQTKLGKASGYSQTNIGWIEAGTMKRPQASVTALSAALRTYPDWLLYGTGQVEAGPPIMSAEEIQQNYNLLSPQDRAEISAAISERVEASREKRKTG